MSPFWVEDAEVLRQRLALSDRDWLRVQISGAAEYLGFWLGPAGAAKLWDKAFRKVEARVTAWASVGLGLQDSLWVYNVYLLSTLSFILQLAPLPPEASQLEARWLRRLIRGHSSFANTPADLQALRRN